METALMREFTIFARYLNFSKAANNLGIAQPTLSSHIASMEMELGFSLVDRGKPIRITPAGKRFCVECERMLAAYGSCVEECRELSKRKTGSLVFEVPIAQGGILDEFNYQLLLFRKEHPTIDVHKHDDPDMSLEDILQKGRADVGFIINSEIGRLSKLGESDAEILPVKTRPLGPYYLWIDESHPLAKHDSIEIADLGGCRFILPSSIRYQGLERLGVVAEGIVGTSSEYVFWPGKYEECIMGIDASEVMIVNDNDLRDPAYHLVPHRKTVHVRGFEELVKPCFIFLASNENPALETLRDFLRG